MKTKQSACPRIRGARRGGADNSRQTGSARRTSTARSGPRPMSAICSTEHACSSRGCAGTLSESRCPQGSSGTFATLASNRDAASHASCLCVFVECTIVFVECTICVSQEVGGSDLSLLCRAWNWCMQYMYETSTGGHGHLQTLRWHALRQHRYYYMKEEGPCTREYQSRS